MWSIGHGGNDDTGGDYWGGISDGNDDGDSDRGSISGDGSNVDGIDGVGDNGGGGTVVVEVLVVVTMTLIYKFLGFSINFN